MMSSGTFPELARWWRRRKSASLASGSLEEDDGATQQTRPISKNPRTLLLLSTRTPDGFAFVRGRVRSLRKLLRDDDDPRIRVLLALYLEKQGENHLEEALKEMDLALARSSSSNRVSSSNSSDGNGWAKSERARLAKALDALRVREKALLENPPREPETTAAPPRPPFTSEPAAAVAAPVRPARGSAGETGAEAKAPVPHDGDHLCQGAGRKRPRFGEDSGLDGHRGCGGGSLVPPPVPPPPVPPLSSLADRVPPVRFEAVDERTASTLTYKEFVETYALRGRPVVIKGGAYLCFEGGRPWCREELRKQAGGQMVAPRRWVPDSVSWARLEEAGQISLEKLLGPPSPPPSQQLASSSITPLQPSAASTAATLQQPASSGIATLKRSLTSVAAAAAALKSRREGISPAADAGQGSPCGQAAVAAGTAAEGKVVSKDAGASGADRQEPLYLHDWSLPQNLGADSPLLTGRFQVPRYFAGDMLQRLAGQGLPYTDSWPSLFIGPKGSKSDTHIDSFGSHFWMALLEGKKQWLLFRKEDAPLLYPVWPEGCHDPVFEAELVEPDAARTPAALLAKGSSCILEAGDLLFVPSGCPHHVENLTDTLALSCNYVDATNVDASLKALRDQALTDPGAGKLASALCGCSRKLARGQGEVPWALLKKWPRAGEVCDWLPA